MNESKVTQHQKTSTKKKQFALLDSYLLELWPYLKDRHYRVLPHILKHAPNMYASTRTFAKS